MKEECENALKINYNLQMRPDTVLHIANAEEFQWLLQPELKAIKDGLVFKELKHKNSNYRGYVNKDGKKEGVGIEIFNSGKKYSG
jgi:hypothetical protein